MNRDVGVWDAPGGGVISRCDVSMEKELTLVHGMPFKRQSSSGEWVTKTTTFLTSLLLSCTSPALFSQNVIALSGLEEEYLELHSAVGKIQDSTTNVKVDQNFQMF